ncbi:MAG: methyltransferase domain-containing protein [Cyanobacteria bacterium J06643_4]
MNDTSWDAKGYQAQCNYVWHHGESLLTQLNAQSGERILDLGCGTGQLTAEIAQTGAQVIGFDSDRAMVEQAKANYTHLTFQVADAANFQVEAPMDAVFSNAVLHWVTQAEAAINCIAKALKPGGRFVAELGGQGNVQSILGALATVTHREDLNPWYFPSLLEYVTRLEAAGLTVEFAHLFDRPTPLGEAGLAGWLEMFSLRFFPELSPQAWAETVSAVEAQIPQQYQDGEWVADYRRLRVIAVKS